MTKRERAQVVELLRCAADCQQSYRAPIAGACCDLYGGLQTNAFDLAHAAKDDVPDLGLEDYQTRLLEAALRVEQGEWP